MVRLEGFEPSTSGSTNQRSNQLSYSRTCFVSASKPFSCQPTQTIRLIVNICGNFIKQKMRYVQWRTNASDQLRNLKFGFIWFVGPFSGTPASFLIPPSSPAASLRGSTSKASSIALVRASRLNARSADAEQE